MATTRPVTRFLTPHDVDRLVVLEAEKWSADQAATGEEMAERIRRHPDLSVGAFCAETGEAIASLFMKPVPQRFWRYARDWHDCATCPEPVPPVPPAASSLFGISLSSRRPEGVASILKFYWPHALAAGWRDIYLGSPIPGWRDWSARHPGRDVAEYVALRNVRGQPLDPQLRYYEARGFRHFVAIKPGYFPHAASEDIGVILRGDVPLAGLAPIWRALRPERTRRFTDRIAAYVL